MRKVGKNQWEFHFNHYYWHGSADNAYEARAKGWSAWLAENYPEYVHGRTKITGLYVAKIQ